MRDFVKIGEIVGHIMCSMLALEGPDEYVVAPPASRD